MWCCVFPAGWGGCDKWWNPYGDFCFSRALQVQNFKAGKLPGPLGIPRVPTEQHSLEAALFLIRVTNVDFQYRRNRWLHLCFPSHQATHQSPRLSHRGRAVPARTHGVRRTAEALVQDALGKFDIPKPRAGSVRHLPNDSFARDLPVLSQSLRQSSAFSLHSQPQDPARHRRPPV